MKAKWLNLTIFAVLCTGMTACDEGKYNALECDQSYVAECIDVSNYMFCNIQPGQTTGMLQRVECSHMEYCDQTVTNDAAGNRVFGAATCVPFYSGNGKPASCTENATQCQGNSVQTCINGTWITTVASCQDGCVNGACVVPGTGCDGGTCDNTPENPNPSDPAAQCPIEGATQCDGNIVQTCTDGKWVNAATPCANGCEFGLCIENVTSCSFESKCDGNIMKSCYDLSDYDMGIMYSAENCRNYNMECAELEEDGETYAYCLKPCDTVDATAPMCVEDYFSSYVTTGVCTDVGNGQLYYLESLDGDFEECPGFCDYVNDTCLILSEDEGKPCDDTFVERCENGNAVYCDDGIVAVETCVDNEICKVNAQNQMALCVESCTTENESVFICDDSYYEDYAVEFLDTYTCQKSTDNDLALFPISQQLCSSCQDLTCTVTDADKGIGLEVGDSCNLNLFENHCANANTMYSCEVDYMVMDYVVTASTCTDSCQVAIANNKHTVACAQGTCETLGSTTLACDSTEDGAQFSTTQTCLATESGTNHYFVTDYEECDGACNPETKTCAMLHPDQGKSCTGMADYPDNCQNNVLAYCYDNAVAVVDCSSEPGYSCQISNALGGYGDCVQTCDTPTELAPVCEYDSYYETDILYTRICETIGDANYYFNAVEDACYEGCNDAGNGCAE